MRKTKLNTERKETELERSHVATSRDRCAKTLLVDYNLVVMHRLMVKLICKSYPIKS